MQEPLVPVRPVPVAVGAAVLAAAFLLVTFCVRSVPVRLVNVFGAPDTALARDGGLRMVWQPPEGVENLKVVDKLIARSSEHVRVRWVRDGAEVEVAGVPQDSIDETAKLLVAGGGLEFHEVVESEEMSQLARKLGMPARGTRPPAGIDIDHWQEPETGKLVTDYYFYGDTRDAIDAIVADARRDGWSLPAGTHLAYEHVVKDDGTTYWKTYVIRDEVPLDGFGVQNATVSADQYTGKPVVILDFTREAGETFGDVTARIVGHKLAILVGGEVKSAPVINSAIRGGRALINMGASTDPSRAGRDARALASVFRTGSLPAGGTLVRAEYVAPANEAVWVARGAIAVSGGALVGLIVLALVWFTRPSRRRAPHVAGAPVAWSRLVVVLLAPGAIYSLSRIPTPAIHATDWAGQAIGADTSIGMLGVMPVLIAYVLAELVAVAVPPWRRARHRGREHRAPIGYLVVMFATALVAIQSWLIVDYLRSRGVVDAGVMPRIEILVAHAAATLAFVGVAQLIRVHGLGNGYGALLVGGWAIVLAHGRLLPTFFAGQPSVHAGEIRTLVIASALVVAVPTVVALRWRIARAGEAPLRALTTGIAPTASGGGVLYVVGLVAVMGVPVVAIALGEWVFEVQRHPYLELAGALVLAVAWSALLARPSLVARLAIRQRLAAPSWTAWGHATAISVAYAALIVGITLATQYTSPFAIVVLAPGTAALATAWLLDVVDDVRTRRVVLDRVWSIYQLQYADLVDAALRDAGIPCVLSGQHLQTLLAAFGSFAPVEVLVAPEHAPQARVLLGDLFEE